MVLHGRVVFAIPYNFVNQGRTDVLVEVTVDHIRWYGSGKHDDLFAAQIFFCHH